MRFSECFSFKVHVRLNKKLQLYQSTLGYFIGPVLVLICMHSVELSFFAESGSPNSLQQVLWTVNSADCRVRIVPYRSTAPFDKRIRT